MAHYSSNSQLWYEDAFLALGRLERQLVLYMMHGPARSNVPGIIEDSPVNIADRLREDVDDVRAALEAMAQNPEVLRWDRKRVLSSPLVARMDPHCGSRNIRGWHKNWAHLPDVELKYQHIEVLKGKVDLSNEEQVRVWNDTFGAERPAHAVAGHEPAQLRLIHDAEAPPKPSRGGAKQAPRHQETVKGLPNRDDVKHIGADEYIKSHAGDLITHGQVRALGADLDMFQAAMDAMARKAPGHKRPAEWDATAANYIETEIFKRRMNGTSTRGHHHEDNRGGGGSPRRAAQPRNRGAAADDQSGQWAEVLSAKASQPSVFSDT